jgi:uncharacterized membrane protein YfcA
MLGLGGGIVLAPALLYGPPLLGLASFEMRQVSGLTAVQALAASLVGAAAHKRAGTLSASLVLWMGAPLVASALTGGYVSVYFRDEILRWLFVLLALLATVLAFLPPQAQPQDHASQPRGFHKTLAVTLAAAVGFLCGAVGQGGSFLLIPCMVHVLKIPLRLAMGSNMGLALLSSLATFAGKVASGQVNGLLAFGVALPGAVGSYLGVQLARRVQVRVLSMLLALLIGAASVGMLIELLMTHETTSGES